MSKLAWTPWHEIVELRPDVKSGELSLSQFAADLYDVVMNRGTEVYRKPSEFFALTYPTYNLRELAKDVVLRLAGKNDKAVRQLELTYGGGKTHTLITLLHLVSDPANLPDLPAVTEFLTHIGHAPPRTKVVTIAFDKLDAEKGMEVLGPIGEKRWLRHPWSVLAFQVAGADGLRLLHADGQDAERESAPAENLLVDLLSVPAKSELSVLILIDEVLMYAREKVGLESAWRSRLVNFFQYLTQAATKLPRCCIVASLLASEPSKSDTLGKEIAQELFTIFRREREEGVQPVLKEDVAEVLRRRFFKSDSIRDSAAFLPHVVAALKGVTMHDDQTVREGKVAEDRFLRSYPFHPDLTEVLYTKWTQLEGFQRTRGILRTFALALRDAVKWDQSPLIGPNVFLAAPGAEDVSQAARELTNVAAAEEYDGKKHEWTNILQGELRKAREIETDVAGINCREVEQAVLATFLHSQPIGQKASLRDLVLLVSPSRPDKIQLEKALRRWADCSWFLDEGEVNAVPVNPDGTRSLPKSWRLGSKPNLTQMHHDACGRVSADLVEVKLDEAIGKVKSLTGGTSSESFKVRVHLLPERPKDIEDDGEFHFAVLSPKAASTSGNPSSESCRFLNETTSADKPRVFRNAIVLATPSREGLDVARSRIREYLGWEEVQAQLKGQEMDPIRAGTLVANLDLAKKKIPEAIQQAYCVVVTVSDKNEPQAFKLTLDSRPLFEQIKSDGRSRIQETAVSYEALLPDGPYELWHSGETARRVKDLVGAFAQFTHLPKMLNRQAILDTLIQGCRDGHFVLRLIRPDRSAKTIWRQEPDEGDLKNPSLEVVLAESADLTAIDPRLLCPGALPDLWKEQEITVGLVRKYFFDGKVIKVPKQGYDEPIVIPKAAQTVVDAAIEVAVKEGKLWLVSGPTSLCGEEIPAGVLTDAATLQLPPAPILVTDLLLDELPGAWANGVATGTTIAIGLAKRTGKPLPWPTLRNALDGAFRARMLERTLDSGFWPCEAMQLEAVKVRVPEQIPDSNRSMPESPSSSLPGVRFATTYLKPNQVQDLAEQIGEIINATVGHDLKVQVRIEVSGAEALADDMVAKVNHTLNDVCPGWKLE